MVVQCYFVISCFCAIFISFPTEICYCQQVNMDEQSNLYMLVNSKVDSFLENDFLLMNARYFTVKHTRAEGVPYFETNNDSVSRLVLDKKEYNNVCLIYDIYEQKLSVIAEESGNNNQILELNNPVINRFYLDGKAFINSSELPLLPKPGFYEEIFLGKHLKVYAKWYKEFNRAATDENIGSYSTQKRKLLLEIDEKIIEISSKRSFLNIFVNERKKIKAFLRKNRTRLSKSDNVNLIKLFKYVDSL